ncbi:MAG TPA: ArsC/Spx/MgsR family protein [Streptosporangiaceae bacterium]|nr:ArsC/Spx/MgsR family protein [Streptosporangiaceae bacterium]
MAEADVVVWYNPRCSKCRGAEELLAKYGVSAQRVFYLDNPPHRTEINRVLELLGATDPRELMRTAEPRYRELGLGDASADELIEAMTRYPELIQRPVVIWPDRAVIARPPELLLPLLEAGRDPKPGKAGDVMLASSPVVAFAAAADLGRARAFYEQVLGLPVVHHDDFACVLDANGTMLRITAVSEVAKPGYTILGWRVADITAMVRGLAAKGVTFLRYDGMDQDDDGVWTTPSGDKGDKGDKIAWFADPDGNILSLTQFL